MSTVLKQEAILEEGDSKKIENKINNIGIAVRQFGEAVETSFVHSFQVIHLLTVCQSFQRQMPKQPGLNSSDLHISVYRQSSVKTL